MTFREQDLDAIDPRLFAIYYAIRLPDGRLHTRVEREKYHWWIAGFDLPGSREPAIRSVTPCVYRDRQEAETELAELRRKAAEVGIPYYGGVIVTALRTPFLPDGHDPATVFAEHVNHWLTQQQKENP